MSGETESERALELVRAAFESWNAGDIAAVRASYAPDTVLHHPSGRPEPGLIAEAWYAWPGQELPPPK